MKHLLTLLALMTMALTTSAADTRMFEMRTYYAVPGKLDDLHARFRNHTMKLFEKHGMQNIGYWVPLDNPDNKLIYILAYPDKQARGKAWKAFMSDPDWKAAQKKSEENGPLVAKVETVYLAAADYSPAIKPSAGKEARTFELRTYTSSKGNLAALDSRFRDHTLKLFTKHGMEHTGYWHLVPEDNQDKEAAKPSNSQNTLLYIIAHKSREAADESFKTFRADPDWLKAREESEKKAGGSLTEGGMAGVKSLFLKPTDYSPTK